MGTTAPPETKFQLEVFNDIKENIMNFLHEHIYTAWFGLLSNSFPSTVSIMKIVDTKEQGPLRPRPKVRETPLLLLTMKRFTSMIELKSEFQSS